MKKNLFISLFIMLFCTSCSNKQKPSPRIDVWGNDILSTTESVKDVELKGDRVLVPFKRTESDLAEVQIFLNGVPFNIWWDTGASLTCISSLEFVKLKKEGKVNDEDYAGSITSNIADGSTTEEAVYVIKEVLIKGQDENHYLRLHDVLVAVSENITAPLLLGQNVIQNLPKHAFNDSKGIIEFEEK